MNTLEDRLATMNRGEKEVWEVLKGFKSVPIKQLTTTTGRANSGVYQILDRMIKRGLIYRVGQGMYAAWKSDVPYATPVNNGMAEDGFSPADKPESKEGMEWVRSTQFLRKGVKVVREGYWRPKIDRYWLKDMNAKAKMAHTRKENTAVQAANDTPAILDKAGMEWVKERSYVNQKGKKVTVRGHYRKWNSYLHGTDAPTETVKPKMEPKMELIPHDMTELAAQNQPTPVQTEVREPRTYNKILVEPIATSYRVSDKEGNFLVASKMIDGNIDIDHELGKILNATPAQLHQLSQLIERASQIRG